MQIPSYFLPRPAVDWNASTIEAFENLIAQWVTPGTGAEIPYTLSVPKWQFLCYLTDHHDILLHGSGDPNIAEFEPRQSNDIQEFGAQQAIYAASDGLWPMYFAILDRVKYPMSLVNGCSRRRLSPSTLSDPYYFFSISQTALTHQPWRIGTIYLLPRETFTHQPPITYQGMEICVQQWASLVPVKPLAKLTVTADDFPFLSQIRGHDDATIMARAQADPDAFPWLDDEEMAPLVWLSCAVRGIIPANYYRR